MSDRKKVQQQAPWKHPERQHEQLPHTQFDKQPRIQKEEREAQHKHMTADYAGNVVGILLEIPDMLLVFASSPVSKTIKQSIHSMGSTP